MIPQPGKKLSIGLCLAGGAAIGFAVWALSGSVAGTPEPWDSNFWFYVLGLGMPATILGFFVPRRFGFAYLGVWVGQVVGMSAVTGFGGDWFILGLISTAIGSLVGLAGYAAGSALGGGAARPAAGEPPEP